MLRPRDARLRDFQIRPTAIVDRAWLSAHHITGWWHTRKTMNVRFTDIRAAMNSAISAESVRPTGLILGNVCEQSNEPRPQHGLTHRSLVFGTVPRATPRQNVTFPIDHRSQGAHVLEIDIDRPGGVVASVRTKTTTKFLLQSRPFFPQLLDVSSVQCRHTVGTFRPLEIIACGLCGPSTERNRPV